MMQPIMVARWIAGRVFVLLLAACACLSAGCSDRRDRARIDDSGPPVRGGTLEVVGRSDVDHLATTSAYYTPTAWLFRAFTRQLLAYPPAIDYATKTRPAPDLALAVPTMENGGISADGLSYTFRLRRGVRWNSNPPREVTAHDIVRAFKLFCNPVNPVGAPGYYTSTIVGMARYCEQFAGVPGTVQAIREFVSAHAIEGVHAADDFTVVFRLKQPATDFLNLVASYFASPIPDEYLDYLPDSPEFRHHTLSNGPYRIARYIQSREILLDRNPAWDPRTDPIRCAYIDRIRLRLGSDGPLQQMQIEAGTADLSFDEWVPTAELASLMAIDDPTLWLFPPGDHFAGFESLVMNQRARNNRDALKQLSVRRAIALAMDKAAIVQVAGGPRVARPLRQAVPGRVGTRSGADQYVTPGDRGDPQAARRLLAEAGYASGISLRLAYPTVTWMPLAAQVVQASLARAGFDIQLVPYSMNDLYGRLLTNPENALRGEWDLALTGWGPDWFGDNNFRSLIVPLFDSRNFGAATTNYGGYLNPAVDALIDRAITSRSHALAEEAWSDAARLIISDVATVPLIEYKLGYARSRRVRNCTWDASGFNCDLTALWLADAAPGFGDSR